MYDKELYVNNHFFHRSVSSLLLPLAMMVIILSGCDKELTEISESKVMKKITPKEAQLIQSTNRLALTILNAEFSHEKNTIFSPLSIGMALGMISNGISDEQKLKIKKLTGMPANNVNEINKTFNQLITFFQLNPDEMDVRYANSIWFAFGNDVSEDFRSKVMAYYDAEVSELNFTKHAPDHIAKWASYKTEGLFDNFSLKLPERNHEVLIVNAFGLETTWKQQVLTFRSEGLFRADGEKMIKTHTLNWDGANAKWTDNGSTTLLELPMNNGLFYFSVIIPENGTSLQEYLSTFSMDDYHALIDGAMDVKANITMPELKFSDEISFNRALTDAGLSDLFTNQAGLHKAFLNPEVRLADIRHIARVSFSDYSNIPENQKGVFTNEHLQNISVNNPFIFFIRDRHTRTVFFAGFVTDPS